MLVSKILPKPSNDLTKKSSAMQVYIYPEIRCFYLKMHIVVEKLLSRDNHEFFSNNGYILNQCLL